VLAMTAAAIVGTASISSAATARASVWPSSGSDVAGTIITATALSGTFATTGGTAKIKVTGDGVQFTSARACTTVPGTPDATIIDAGGITLVNSSKVVLTLPTLTAGTWQVCIYNVAGDALVAAGRYIAADPPTVTTITPAAGPVYGGSAVTVDGTNFTSRTTAAIGGTALTTIRVARDGTSFTAVMPANSSGAKDLTVTAVGGIGTKSSAFTYMDGVSVTPTTQAKAAKQVIEVTGYGFTSLDFSTDAKVYLVSGAYDPTDSTGVKTNPESATCGSVITVTDSELICTLDGSGVALPEGAFTVTVVSDSAVGAQLVGGYRQTIVASPATYTVAPY
jgi:hypothetical protein